MNSRRGPRPTPAARVVKSDVQFGIGVGEDPALYHMGRLFVREGECTTAARRED